MADRREQAIVLGIRARKTYSHQLMYHLRGSVRPKSAFTAGETRLLRGREPVVALLPDGSEEARRTIAASRANRGRGRPPDEIIEVMYAAPRFEPDPKDPDPPLPWSNEKLDAWAVACVGHAQRVAGPESKFVGAWFHSDETSPHIHAAFVPVFGGRVRWGEVKDAYARPVLGVKSNQRVHHRDAYRGIRDGYFREVGHEFGLVRGRIIWKPEDWKKLEKMRDEPDRMKAAEHRLWVLDQALRTAEAAVREAEARREQAEREAEQAKESAAQKRGEVEVQERDAAARIEQLRKEERELRDAARRAKEEYEIGKTSLLGRQSERGRETMRRAEEAEAKAEEAQAKAEEALAESRQLRVERDAALARAKKARFDSESQLGLEKMRLQQEKDAEVKEVMQRAEEVERTAQAMVGKLEAEKGAAYEKGELDGRSGVFSRMAQERVWRKRDEDLEKGRAPWSRARLLRQFRSENKELRVESRARRAYLDQHEDLIEMLREYLNQEEQRASQRSDMER